MGTYYYLGCLKCREMAFLGKLSEPALEKSLLLQMFFGKHIGHDLRVVGDDSSRDEDLIKTSKDRAYWETDCEVFKLSSQLEIDK